MLVLLQQALLYACLSLPSVQIHPVRAKEKFYGILKVSKDKSMCAYFYFCFPSSASGL